MKRHKLETWIAFTLAVLFILPSYTTYTAPEKYDTTYIAIYSDGHTETVCEDELPPRAIGSTFEYDGTRWTVQVVNDYWYEGLQFDVQYFIVKVVML